MFERRSLVGNGGEATLNSVKLLSSISKNFLFFNLSRSIVAVRPFPSQPFKRSALAMAILAFYLCEILVNGAALAEHDNDDVATEQKPDQPGLKSVKYVEAISGAEFSVRYGLIPGWRLREDLAYKIYLDGKHSQTKVFKKTDLLPGATSWVEDGVKVRSYDDWYLRKYRFADIVLGKLLCNSQFCSPPG